MWALCGEEAVTEKSSARAWEAGVRGCAGCIWFFALGKGKVQVPCSSQCTWQREEAQRSLISPSRGGGLLFWFRVHGGSTWHATWLSYTRVRDLSGLEGERSRCEGATASWAFGQFPVSVGPSGECVRSGGCACGRPRITFAAPRSSSAGGSP